MAARTKTNIDRFVRRMDAVRRAMDGAAEELLRDQAREFVQFVVTAAPKDTNRYARAWAMAGNAAGLGPFPVPEVRESRFWAQNRERLLNQVNRMQDSVDFWTRIIAERYDKQGRRGKWRSDAVRKLARAERRLRRAREELEKFMRAEGGAAILIGRAGKAGNLKLTVRHKIYGGTGREFMVAGRTFIQLHNREAHARIVERRHRLVARGMALARELGVRTYGRSYIERLRRAHVLGRSA